MKKRTREQFSDVAERAKHEQIVKRIKDTVGSVRRQQEEIERLEKEVEINQLSLEFLMRRVAQL